MSAPSCRSCQHSTHSGDALVCTRRESPAWDSTYHGLCSRSSRSRAENARYDQRCTSLAATCEHFTPEERMRDPAGDLGSCPRRRA